MLDSTQEANAYEKSLSRDQKKAGGIFYTPRHIVDYIVQNTVGKLLDRCSTLDDLLHLRVCDPACGAGYFLISALDLMVTRGLARGFSANAQELSAMIQEHCIFGFDIDEAAVQLARSSLPFSQIQDGDTLKLFKSEPYKSLRFDAVIGNPPYGASTASRGDTAMLFIELAHRMAAEDGIHSFIIPKPFLYASNWKNIREVLWNGLCEIVDCGRVWPEVKLEQVIYFCRPSENFKSYRSLHYSTENFESHGKVDKECSREFGFFLNGLSEEEILIGKKITREGTTLGDLVENQRGSMIQSLLKDDGDGWCAVGGKQISRYSSLTKERHKGFIERTQLSDPKAFISADSLLAQNIVAHVQNPVPHLKIIATLVSSDDTKHFVILDTVNQLRNRGPYSSEFLLGILNSKILSWYVYRFIAGKAVRTIHFDSPLTSRIPVPRLDLNCTEDRRRHDELTRLVRRRMNNDTASEVLEEEIESLVCDLYGLSKGEARIVGGSGYIGGSGV